MKSLLIIIASLFVLGCSKTCDNQEKPGCQDTPPTDELCLAYFTRWFYNSDSNSCEEIGYGGCNEWGFDNRQECEACRCE